MLQSLIAFLTFTVVASAGAPPAPVERLRSAHAKDRVEAAVALRKAPTVADAAAVVALVRMLGDERAVPRPPDPATSRIAGPLAVPHGGPRPGTGKPGTAPVKPRPVPTTTPAAEAVITLGLLGAPAVPALHEALEARAVVVRRNAVRALSEVNVLAAAVPLMDALYDADSEVRELAAVALVAIDDPAVTGLLLEALKTPAKARPAILWVLGRRRDAQAGDALLAALKDKDAAMRAAAAEALGDVRETRAVEPLIAAVADTDAAVAGAAAGALGLVRDGRAVEPLVAALGSPHGSVCRRAAEALGHLKDSRAVEGLVRALSAADAGCRAEAAVALRILPDRRAIGSLVPLMKDKDELVRTRAQEALEVIAGMNFGADAAQWEAWWAGQPGR